MNTITLTEKCLTPRKFILESNIHTLSSSDKNSFLNFLKSSWNSFVENLKYYKGIKDVKKVSLNNALQTGYIVTITYISGSADRFSLSILNSFSKDYQVSVEFLDGISTLNIPNISDFTYSFESAAEKLYAIAEELIIEYASKFEDKSFYHLFFEKCADILSSYGSPLLDFLITNNLINFGCSFYVTSKSTLSGAINIKENAGYLSYLITSEFTENKVVFNISSEVSFSSVSSNHYKYTYNIDLSSPEDLTTSLSKDIIKLLKVDLNDKI